MQTAFLISIGSEDSTIQSFGRTVFERVDLNFIAQHSPERLERLKPVAHEGKVSLWGMPETTRGRLKHKASGDLLLFFWEGWCRAYARLEYVFEERSLATALWQNDHVSAHEAGRYRWFAVLSEPSNTRIPLRYLSQRVASVDEWIPFHGPKPVTDPDAVAVIREMLEEAKQTHDPALDSFDNFEGCLVPPPHPIDTDGECDGNLQLDYSEPDKALGDAGEKWVFEMEKRRLLRSRQPEYAYKVRWTAHEGETPGYDVSSFDPVTFREITIEVKTTRGGKNTPFDLTQNEKTHIDANPGSARIYRLFNFNSPAEVRFYILTARTLAEQSITPKVYSVRPLTKARQTGSN